MKARVLVDALDQATRACLIARAQHFGYQTDERREALKSMAISFAEGTWHPDGLTHEDVELVGYGLVTDIVWAVANEIGYNTLESAIYDIFQRQSNGQALPAMRKLDRSGREQSRLGPRSRVGVRRLRV
jgi:hypothetical protein